MKLAIILLAAATACGSSSNKGTVDGSGGGGQDGNGNGSGSGSGNHGTDGGVQMDGPQQGTPRTIFVIVMENESSSLIYGNTTAAPYINNTLVPIGAQATSFTDELPSLIPSEPHYVWMEGGTNAYTDHTFTTDNDASASNSTNSTDHLVTKLKAAGVSWMSYQEGMTANTCPISSNTGSPNFYATKHDPFVFFQDVSGSPPSASNAYCVAHHKPYSAFVADLASGNLASYVFITPNLCDDMHGATGCSQTGTNGDINMGDNWLKSEMPRILDYANAHNAVVYLTWDEGSTDQKTPFLAFSPHIKTGPIATAYTHSSLVKSIAEQLNVTPPSVVANAVDFTDMFETGYFK